MAVDLKVKNSLYNLKNGRYALGGKTEVSAFGLEWWNKKQLATDATDLVYVIEKKYENKPNMLGYLFYGDEGLWWVIAMYNGIMDPLSELTTGKVLLVPMLERVKAEMFSEVSPGGVASTREQDGPSS